jgi:hypothetical protein
VGKQIWDFDPNFRTSNNRAIHPRPRSPHRIDESYEEYGECNKYFVRIKYTVADRHIPFTEV